MWPWVVAGIGILLFVVPAASYFLEDWWNAWRYERFMRRWLDD